MIFNTPWPEYNSCYKWKHIQKCHSYLKRGRKKFSLSVPTYQASFSKKLPTKWVAIESLIDHIFSEKYSLLEFLPYIYNPRIIRGGGDIAQIFENHVAYRTPPSLQEKNIMVPPYDFYPKMTFIYIHNARGSTISQNFCWI